MNVKIVCLPLYEYDSQQHLLPGELIQFDGISCQSSSGVLRRPEFIWSFKERAHIKTS